MISCVDGENRGVEHELVAAGQVAHIGAVLVHDGEPLDAVLLRPGLVDEDDAGVEIALLAGEPFVDRVRDDVGDAAPIVRRGEILLAGKLLAGEHVPQPEFGFQPAVALAGDAAGDERLRIDGAPIGKVRHVIDAGELLQERGGIDRQEQAGAFQVGGNDLGDADRGVVVAVGAAEEIRNGDRQRLEIALGDVDDGPRPRMACRQRQAAGGGTERERAPSCHGEIGYSQDTHHV